MFRKKQLKIAIFHLAFIYSGGGERLVLEEAIRLQKLGHAVDCFVPVVNDINCFPELQKKVKIKRILPKMLPNWYPDKALLSVLAACLLIPLLFYKFRKYDVYFGANQPGPWISYILSVINRKPYFIYLAQPTRLVHPRLIDQTVGLRFNFGFSTLKYLTIVFKPLISYFDLISIKNAQAILANGTYVKGILEEVYSIKAINCPAGSKRQRRLREKDINKRFYGKQSIGEYVIPKPYILLTNRHFPHKKFEYALEAFKKISRKRIHMVISGQETEYTKKLKKLYHKEKRVHFVNLLSENDLHKAYLNSSVYVYPAPEEDFGMGIIEAMSYGIPVIAWGNAGPTGIINHGYDGFLARPFDTDDFALYINKVLKNRTLYQKVAANAQEKVNKTYSYLKHIEIIEKIMLSVFYSQKKVGKKRLVFNKKKLKNYFNFKVVSIKKEFINFHRKVF